MHPEHRSIGELAYRLWQTRGCPEGTAEQDWLDAEKQLQSAPPRVAEARAVEARAIEPRAIEPAASDAKWKTAGATRTDSAGR